MLHVNNILSPLHNIEVKDILLKILMFVPPKNLKNLYIYSNDYREYLSTFDAFVSLGNYHLLCEKPISFAHFYVLYEMSYYPEQSIIPIKVIRAIHLNNDDVNSILRLETINKLHKPTYKTFKFKPPIYSSSGSYDSEDDTLSDISYNSISDDEYRSLYNELDNSALCSASDNIENSMANNEIKTNGPNSLHISKLFNKDTSMREVFSDSLLNNISNLFENRQTDGLVNDEVKDEFKSLDSKSLDDSSTKSEIPVNPGNITKAPSGGRIIKESTVIKINLNNIKINLTLIEFVNCCLNNKYNIISRLCSDYENQKLQYIPEEINQYLSKLGINDIKEYIKEYINNHKDRFSKINTEEMDRFSASIPTTFGTHNLEEYMNNIGINQDRQNTVIFSLYYMIHKFISDSSNLMLNLCKCLAHLDSTYKTIVKEFVNELPDEYFDIHKLLIECAYKDNIELITEFVNLNNIHQANEIKKIQAILKGCTLTSIKVIKWLKENEIYFQVSALDKCSYEGSAIEVLKISETMFNVQPEFFFDTICDNDDYISLVWLLYRGNITREPVKLFRPLQKLSKIGEMKEPADYCQIIFVLLYNYLHTGNISLQNADLWESEVTRNEYINEIRTNFLMNVPKIEKKSGNLVTTVDENCSIC
jgi:hypothetical protein